MLMQEVGEYLERSQELHQELRLHRFEGELTRKVGVLADIMPTTPGRHNFLTNTPETPKYS